MARAIDPTWKRVIAYRSAATLQPGKQARTNICRQLELYRPTGLLPDDDRPGSDLSTGNHISDLNFNEIAATQLAVEGEIEKRTVAKSTFAIKEEANSPNLLLCKRSLGTDHFPGIPCRAILHCGVVL